MTLRVEICGEKTLLERKKLKGKKKKREKKCAEQSPQMSN